MSRFEYLSVLVSIVLALGISEVLVCWARLIQHRGEVRFSWLHGFWTAFVVVLMIQFWWGYWNFRVIEDWTFLGLFIIVFETMLVVIASLLLTPGRSFEPGLDLEQHFFANVRPFFLVGTLMVASLTLADILLLAIPAFSVENLIRYMAILLCLVMSCIGSRVFHYVAALAFGALLAFFIVIAQVY